MNHPRNTLMWHNNSVLRLPDDTGFKNLEKGTCSTFG